MAHKKTRLRYYRIRIIEYGRGKEAHTEKRASLNLRNCPYEITYIRHHRDKFGDSTMQYSGLVDTKMLQAFLFG